MYRLFKQFVLPVDPDYPVDPDQPLEQGEPVEKGQLIEQSQPFGLIQPSQHFQSMELAQRFEQPDKQVKQSYQVQPIEKYQLENQRIQSEPVLLIRKYQQLLQVQHEKPHFKLLLVGQTGSGKTSCINMMMNLANNNCYTDDRIVAITQNFPIQGKIKTLECTIPIFKNRQSDGQQKCFMSQTQDCNMYSLEGPDVKLTLVDTPGLGDTRGVQQDKDNVRAIIAGIQALTEINAVCLVHKGTDNRKDITLRYYIQEIRGMLTKDFMKNFVVLFTHLNNPMEIVAIDSLKELEIPVDRYCYFENDCLHPLNWYDFPDEKNKKKFIRNKEDNWEENQNQFNKLIDLCKDLIPRKVTDLQHLLVQNETLMNIVCSKQRQIKLKESYKVDLEQAKQTLENVKRMLSEIKDSDINQQVVTSVKTEVKKTRKAERQIQIPEPGIATHCNVCNVNCHLPCYLKEIYKAGDKRLIRCDAFGGKEICLRCGCGVEVHGHVEKVTKEFYDFEYTDLVAKNVITIVTHDNLKQLKQEYEQNVKDLLKEIKEKEELIKGLSLQIARDLRIIVYLYKKIEETSMKPMNDAMIEYIQIRCINATKKDETISQETRLRLEIGFNNIIERFQILQNEIKRNNNQNIQLNPEEIQELGQEMKDVEGDLLKKMNEDYAAHQGQQNNQIIGQYW